MRVGKLVVCLKRISLFHPTKQPLSLVKKLRYQIKLSRTKYKSNVHRITFTPSSTDLLAPLPVSCWTDRFTYCGSGIPESFILDLSYTALLFWTLYVDLYEEGGRLMGDKHLGRVEVRLQDYLVEGQGDLNQRDVEKWFCLYQKHQTPSSLSLWHIASIGSENWEQHSVGQLKLSLRFLSYHQKPAVSLQATAPLQTLSPVSLVEETCTTMSSSTTINSNRTIWSTTTISTTTLSSEQHCDSEVQLLPSAIAQELEHFNDDELSTAIKRLQHLFFTFTQGIQINSGRIVVGYLLLRKFYQQNVPLLCTGNSDQVVVDDLHLSKFLWSFCMSSFGWKGLVLSQRKNEKRSIIGTMVRSDDLEAILKCLNITPECLIQLSISGGRDKFVPAFFLAYHPALNCVVLTIRGTCDYEDTNIDLACDYVPFQGGFVHYGMWKAAKWLLNNVYSKIIRAMQERGAKAFYITGHSLGGSIGSVFYLLLKDFLKGRPEEEMALFTVCKCVAFGAAPTVSKEIITQLHNNRFFAHSTTSSSLNDSNLQASQLADSSSTSSNIINLVYGSDIIPSLSYGTVMDFKQMLLCSSHISTSTNWFQLRLVDSSAEKMDILRQCRSLILSHRNKNTKLYLPGLVYHAYYKESGGNQLTVELSDYSLFNELVFGNNCFTDHLPTRYDSMISKL